MRLVRDVALVVIALALAASVYYQLPSPLVTTTTSSSAAASSPLLLHDINGLSTHLSQHNSHPTAVFYSNNTSEKCINVTKRIPTIKVDFAGVRGGGCLNRSFASSKNYFPKTALSSFPGSGNTWVRYLLEQLTGNYLNQERLAGNYLN